MKTIPEELGYEICPSYNNEVYKKVIYDSSVYV